MGSVTLRVILWTPSGSCAPWGHLGQQQQVQGLHHPHHQVQRFSRTRRALWRKPDRDSTNNEILQRPRFYKERDSTKNEILQNEEGTLKKARPRFYTIGALRPMGGLWASSNKSRAPFTLIIKFRDSPERGGHFEESPTEILQRMRFYKDPDSTKNEILQRTRFYKERDSTKNEILQRTRFSRTRRRKPDRDSTPSGPSAPWGASGPAATSPRPPSPSSSSSPGLTPLLPSLQTHSIGSIGPGPCVSQDVQDAHQRPQRRGNKEVLELVLGFPMIPATA